MTATLDYVSIADNDRDGISVTPFWAGVDRPQGHGFGLLNTAAHRKLAERLKAAIEAGVVFPNATVTVNVNGATYVDSDCLVGGRTMNADLTRLGF